MAVSQSTRTAGPFPGTGAIVPLPFTFKVFSQADVLVEQTDATGAITPLVLGSGYTVTLNADQDVSPGGVVTPLAAPAVGTSLFLTSQVAETQPAVLINGGPWLPKVVEAALDRVTILVQQLRVRVDRAIAAAAAAGSSVLTALAGAAGAAAIGFMASGAGALLRTVLVKLLERPTPEDYGADPTGVRDSSAAFTAGWAVNNTLWGTPNAIYLLKDINNNGRKFVSNGSVLRPAPGARWMMKLTGYGPEIDAVVQDNEEYTRSTTLSSSVLSTATALPVVSATGIEPGQVLLVDVDAAGSWFITTVATVVGNVVNIRDQMPSAAASGKQVVALFGAVWVEDATDAIVKLKVVNARGALLIKPSATGINVKTNIPYLSVDGCKYFGIVKQGNAAEVTSKNIRLRGGYVESGSATGNGTAGPFTVSTNVNVSLKRDLTVKVNGVAVVYGTDWTYTTDKTISFLAGHFPAVGAAITWDHFRDGVRGLVDDGRSASVIRGGNEFGSVETLDFFIGQHYYYSEHTLVARSKSDTNSFVAVQVENCASDLRFADLYLGFNRANLKIFNSSQPFVTGLYTALVGASDLVNGTVDNNIELDGTCKLDLDTSNWYGSSYGVAGTGSVNWRGGRHINFFSTPGTPVAANAQPYYINLNGHTLGPTLPTQAQILASDTVALELLVQVGIAPGAGQTFTYQLNVNGVDVGGTVVISGTATGPAAPLRLTQALAKGDRVILKLQTSAGAASTEHRAVLVTR